MPNRPSLPKLIRGSFAAGVLVVTLLCIMPMDVVRLRHLSEYAVHVMFIWLALSMFFLLLRREKMMWTALLAAGVLAIFLRDRSNVQLSAPVVLADRPQLTVGLFNTVDVDALPRNFFGKLTAQPPDLLTIQEVDPRWRTLLLDSLGAVFPYHLEVRDLGTYGMLAFSRHPLTRRDSFRVAGSPVLVGELQIPGTVQPLCFVTTYVPPLLSSRALRQQQAVLDSLGVYCDRIRKPLITLGAFNAVAWSPEMDRFLDQTLLQNSRRGLGAFTEDNRPDPFDIQRDHIFFSNHFNRLSFRAVDWQQTTGSNRHGGFVGTYQFANTLDDDPAAPTEF